MAQIDRLFGYTGDIAIKLPVVVATTANITLSGLQTIDGTTVAAGDRVLVKNQTDATQNGIYFVATGAWTRTPDFDGSKDVATGTAVLVTNSASEQERFWQVTTTDNPILIGTSDIDFTKIELTSEAYIEAIEDNIASINAVATNIADVNTAATNIAAIIAAPTAASTATTQAGIATTQASNAAASAILAGSTFIATSTTSSDIEVANGKAFTTQTNKNFQAGQFMTVVDSTSNANYMFGRVTSYDNATGALVFDSQEVGGSGTLTSWNISISATTLSEGGGGLDLGGVASGRYYFGFLNSYSTSLTTTIIANRLYAIPFILTEAETFNRIGIEVLTLSTGSARLGIYNCENGAPTTLVADLGTVSVTSTGEKEITISQALAAGTYMLAAVFDGTPVVARGIVQTAMTAIAGGAPATPVYIQTSHTFGALPAPYGTPTYATAALEVPAIWLRKV
jgi:hypothetical protein